MEKWGRLGIKQIPSLKKYATSSLVKMGCEFHKQNHNFFAKIVDD